MSLIAATKELVEQIDDLVISHQRQVKRMEAQSLALRREAEAKAEYKGKLSAWQNLSIEAYPRTSLVKRDLLRRTSIRPKRRV